MIVETSIVKKLKITEVERLDTISVILEDFEPRKGKIIIECSGKSWSAYWGGMGDRTISEFFRSAHNEYIIGCLSPGMESEITDYDDLTGWLKRELFKRRREHEFDSDEARNLFIEIEENCCDEESWLYESKASADIVPKIVGDEFWHSLPEKPNPKYQYLSRIVDAVKAGLKEIS